VALQQQDVAAQIIAAQQFCLDELILFGGKRARKYVVFARDVVGISRCAKR